MYAITITDDELLPIQHQIAHLDDAQCAEITLSKCRRLHQLLDREFARNKLSVRDYISLSMKVLSKKSFYKAH